MRHVFRLAIIIGMAGVRPGAAEPPGELPEAAMKALKSLEGKWRVVRFLHSDRETDASEDEVVVRFKGDTIDFAQSATGVVVALDPATDPKCLDFKVPMGSGALAKGATYESVYQLAGDTLTWAVHTGRGKNRPTGFDKPTDVGGMVMILRRVKE